VQFRSSASRIVLGRIVLPLAAALAIAGCADVDLENKEAWFAKPFQFVSRTGGYTYSDLQESKERGRPITGNDLVDNNGACPAPAPQPTPAATAANQAPAAAPAPAAAANQAPAAPLTSDADTLLGGGVALGMSECDVVYRAGAPNSVQISKNPNGDRTSVLTFNGGPRPGIYNFVGGALVEIDQVQAPPAPPTAKKQTAKKKPTPSAKSSKQAATQ
jgi:hypothetical protein